MFDQLGNSVYRRRYESLDLNVGIVLGDDAVLVVDTRSSQAEAAVFREELSSLTRLPVRWVINTHWHWDHVFGNAGFPEAEIWGHELCQIALSDRGEDMKVEAKKWMDSQRHPEIDAVEIIPPSATFSQEASLDIGRGIELRYHGFGHTDADLVVSVPDADVAFFGDLVEEGAPPSFGDSYPVAWPLTLRLASNHMTGTVVPGHGDVVDPAFVSTQREELVEVAELATSFVNGELGLAEACSSGPYSQDVMRSALLRAQAVAS